MNIVVGIILVVGSIVCAVQSYKDMHKEISRKACLGAAISPLAFVSGICVLFGVIKLPWLFG